MNEYNFHPFSEAFPLLEGEAFNQLIEDIRQNGLLHPITLFENMILDGRNRYRACVKANIPLKTAMYEGTTPLEFVVSENLHRRHLDQAQRAMVAARIAKMPLGGKIYKDRSLLVGTDLSPSISASSAAEMLNVGRSTVEAAKQVQRYSISDVVQAVESGKIGIKRAVTIAKLPKNQQAEALQESRQKGKSPAKKPEKKLTPEERAMKDRINRAWLNGMTPTPEKMEKEFRRNLFKNLQVYIRKVILAYPPRQRERARITTIELLTSQAKELVNT